jgi:cold shock CspA family protein
MEGQKFCGQVTLWDERRSWGFIEATEMLPFGKQQIFVHGSNCLDPVSLGAYVEFEVGDPFKLNRKPQAIRVTVRPNAPGLEALATGIQGGAQ